jgi:hypothetical protein
MHRHAHFRYLALNQITFMAVHQQLVPSIPSLPNLTSLIFQNVVMSVELVRAMSELPNLTFLIYDIPYPNSLLVLNPDFGTFAADELARHSPSNLQSISVRFQSNDAEYLAFEILYSIIRASRKTLQLLNIDFNCCCGWMPVHRILLEHYPNLRRIYLYHTNFTWTPFAGFYEVHSEQLKHVGIMFVGARRADRLEGVEQFFLHEVPGLGHLTAPQYAVPLWRFDHFTVNLRIDHDCRVSAYEMMMVGGCWEMLHHMVKEHRHLRALSMWDGQVVFDFERSIFQVSNFSREPYNAENPEAPLDTQQILRLVSKDLQSLEVLRFNCDGRGLDGLGRMNTRPLLCVCEADRPNAWCNCPGCEAGVYTPEGRTRIRQAWEENQWHGYQEQIRKIIPFLPKLRLIEWFIWPRIQRRLGKVVPFWEWKIDRKAPGGEAGMTYRLKRKLSNCPLTNPFAAMTPWSPDRGMGESLHCYDF